MNRKLLKISEFDFAYFRDGELVKRGPFTLVKMHMERDGLHDIVFALKIMNDCEDDVADFGFNGGFTISQKYEDANLGFKTPIAV